MLGLGWTEKRPGSRFGSICLAGPEEAIAMFEGWGCIREERFWSKKLLFSYW